MAQEQLASILSAISDPDQVQIKETPEDSRDGPPEAAAEQNGEEPYTTAESTTEDIL